MDMKRSNIFCFSLTIVVFFLLSACDSESPSDQKQIENRARPAKLLKIRLKSNDEFLNYPAVIKSQALRKLFFSVAGKVSEVLVIEAQAVKKGDVLAKLDQTDLKAKLDAAVAQFDNTEVEYQRAVNLIKADAIARTELDQRKSKRDVSQSQLKTAQKALQDSVLIAPFDGTIAKVAIKKLQVLKAGSDAIDVLGTTGFEAKINLPSDIIARSRTASEKAEGSYLVLDAAPERRIPARFKEAALEADATSQTYEVTFTFDVPDDLNILPGMNAVVWFKDPSAPVVSIKKISIPLTAIVIDGDKKYVWVVDDNTMAVSKRPIIIESGVGTTIDVVSGLKTGELIVATGISALSEGMKVTPWLK